MRRGDSPLHDCSCTAFLEPPFFLLHDTRVIKDYLDKVSFDVGEEKWQIGYPRSLNLRADKKMCRKLLRIRQTGEDR